ncbi:MAG: peptidylprolyl isomerase [Actinobacteria bacterium]|nr:peptidylprolyl isomerase [Actinomycetota bacterium]
MMSSNTNSKALKRARQKEARNRKREAEAKAQKRQATIRRFGIIGVIVVIGFGVYAASGGFSSSHPKHSVKLTNKSTTTTTPSSSTTTTPSSSSAAKAQQAADAVAQKAGCPSSPTTPLKPMSFSSPPPMTINTSLNYTAVVNTDIGTFDIALNAKNDPKTVNNFVFLANKGYYNCNAFMRVIPGFMAQTGSRNQTNGGSGSDPGYSYTGSVPPKAPAGTPQYPNGSVAMANSGSTSSNGSQFFIVDGSSGNSLPPNYTLFGHVTSGMSVVNKIVADGNANASANGVPPTVTHRILSIKIQSS